MEASNSNLLQNAQSRSYESHSLGSPLIEGQQVFEEKSKRKSRGNRKEQHRRRRLRRHEEKRNSSNSKLNIIHCHTLS